MPSQSRSRYLGAISNGNAFTSCGPVQPADGLSETAKGTTFRRSCARTTKTNNTRNVAVGIVKKSMATISLAWLRRKVVQFCDDGRGRFGRYLRMVESETRIPSLANSSRIRGLPQVGLAS